ncbi:MAG: MFS transporter [Acholeplasmataceae bacterium]|jgi:MFS family permease|nr:MFS transporter [Acholeplasmataceae bacterium]
MKLNVKNTVYIGLIFFIISLFWQSYDLLIARTLIDKFGLNQTWSGVVMAFDNIMAVILLPVFGALSDRSNSKKGRRTPYIIVGTIVAAFAFMALSYTDYKQTIKIAQTDIVETHYNTAFDPDADKDDANHWYMVVDIMTDEREDAEEAGDISLSKLRSWEESIKDPMISILDESDGSLDNRELSLIRDLYYTYLSERAWEITSTDTLNLFIFSILLFIALVAMATFRSPAVALMPDITIKPLRSKANAIISLMGAIGGISAVYVIMLSGLNKNAYEDHVIVYIAIGIIMLIVLGVFLWKVKEPVLVKEKLALENKYASLLKEQEPDFVDPKLNTFTRRKSLYFLLATIFFLFMGYNAVMSKIADYMPKVLNLNFFDYPFIIAQLLILVSIIPIGILSMYLGRKKTILIGITLLALSFSSVFFLPEQEAWLTAGIVAVAGMGWSMISINTYVMVVELAKGLDVGRYTGYYYAASMTAQILTPILSGYFMDNHELKRLILFPYATVFICIAIVTMLFVTQGEAKMIKKSLLESYDIEGED